MKTKISANNLDNLKRRIDVARGKLPADILLYGAQVVNVFSGETYPANVAICNGVIAGVDHSYQDGGEIYDVSGLYLIPGLIDSHVHIESSMLTPAEYTRAVLPHGTTTVICDPHEMANVMGLEGIRYILDSSKGIPINLFVTASSCVPSTHLETSGAVLSLKEIEELLKWERVIGLAEMMNVPGVLEGNSAELGKLLLANKMGCPIDGHSPTLSGKDLNAYIGAGVSTEHESKTREEALEKLRLGMYIMIREGSAARNLERLLPIVTQETYRRCMFVSDDMHPQDLLLKGNMDYILRKAVWLGMNPVVALSMATINPAMAFRLSNTGAIAPGYDADIVAVDNLREFNVQTVFKNGKPVFTDRKIVSDFPSIANEAARKTMKVKGFGPDRFKIRVRGKKVRVIELISGQIFTRHVVEDICADTDGEVSADTARDLLKIAVIERHHATGNIGLGFVRGFGLRDGALGSSVAHDSHNIIVVGTNDMDMYVAAREIIEIGGGHVVASGGRVLGSLRLSIAGLLSDMPLEELVREEEKVLAAARELGAKPPLPFIKLSFLALPVIPDLKITDKGLVDVNRFEIVGIEP